MLSHCMRRREFLSCTSLVVTGIAAGCLGTIQSGQNPPSEADRTQFEEIKSLYVVSIQNELNKSVGIEVSVTDAERTTVEEKVIAEPGDKMLVSDLFPRSGSYTSELEPYTVSVSADEKSIERTLRPSRSSNDEFVFTIDSDKFLFQKSHRPSADIIISNQRDEDVDVRVTVSDHSDSGAVYDVLTIPSNEVVAYRGVFADERERV